MAPLIAYIIGPLITPLIAPLVAPLMAPVMAPLMEPQKSKVVAGNHNNIMLVPPVFKLLAGRNSWREKKKHNSQPLRSNFGGKKLLAGVFFFRYTQCNVKLIGTFSLITPLIAPLVAPLISHSI